LVNEPQRTAGIQRFEILSWKDSSVPDNAGPEVRELWNEMKGLCEKKSEQPGIVFKQVEPIPLNGQLTR
jgi:hypothetical protein